LHHLPSRYTQSFFIPFCDPFCPSYDPSFFFPFHPWAENTCAKVAAATKIEVTFYGVTLKFVAFSNKLNGLPV